MAKILKPYEAPVDPDLAREILKIPLESWGPEDTPIPRTIGERVEAATDAVKAANEYLAKSALAAIVAEALMRKLKKRGAASIRVNPDGSVILHIAYDEEKTPNLPAPVTRPSRQSTLPTLAELRAEAQERGIDISDLGRQRRAIAERLKATEDEKPPSRLVDESQQTDAPEDRPKTIRRPRKAESATEDLDVDDLLGEASR